jgi:apolipoprotein N-acyltransferase
MKRYDFLFLPFLGGILYSMGFPHTIIPNFFLAPILGIFLLYRNLSIFCAIEQTWKKDFIIILAFSFGHYFSGYYWIPAMLKEFGQLPAPTHYLLGLLFPIMLVPQHFAMTLLHHLFLKKLKFENKFLIKTLIYAFLLCLCEYFIPQQFPTHLGHPWLQLAPYLGMAPHFGTPLFSLLSIWLAFTFIKIDKLKDLKSTALFPIFTFIIFLILNITLPLKRPIQDADQTINIRMVQANIGNFLKVSSERGSFNSLSSILNRYKRLSLRPSSNPVDLIIWPETAFPHLLQSKMMKSSAGFTPFLFKEIIRESNSDFFTGGYDASERAELSHSFEDQYNAGFLFKNINDKILLDDVYHKQLLIPFGETLPFGAFNHQLSKVIQNISYFKKGERFTLFETKSNFTFVSAICYEILFPNYIRKYLNSLTTKPNFIINITNDSWYGDTSEPYQHLFLSHWRAIEFQIPIFRMTNTGITSVLFENGLESDRLLYNTQEILDTQLARTQNPPTLYQKWGISLTILIFSFIFMICFLIEKKRK